MEQCSNGIRTIIDALHRERLVVFIINRFLPETTYELRFIRQSFTVNGEQMRTLVQSGSLPETVLSHLRTTGFFEDD
jgi:hypothetical protein